MAQINQPMIDIEVHRRVLGFLNAARSPQDLMMPPPNEIPLFDPRLMNGAEDFDEHPPSQDHAGLPKGVKPIMDRKPIIFLKSFKIIFNLKVNFIRQNFYSSTNNS